MAAMKAYSWPGNVRELRNVIERAMILGSARTLHVTLSRTRMHPLRSRPIEGTLEEAERAHILQVLDETAWRIRGAGGAAEILSIKPTTLESRIKKLELKRSK
jgi:DNA-binding NtrC family response regulator